MPGIPGTHPFCNRHDRPFLASRGTLSDWECRYAQVCASKAPQASRPSRTPQGRVGTERRPCRSHSPLFRGLACLYIQLAASLSFAPAEKDAASKSAAALARRGFQTSPARGNREKPRPGLPKAVPDAAGTSAKARCRSLPPTLRPARNNLPKAALKNTHSAYPAHSRAL